MILLVMVLDDSTKLGEVLHAWRRAGVSGVTVLDSTGMNRLMTRTEPHAAMTRFGAMFASARVGHNTLFAVLANMELAEIAVRLTEEVLGDLNQPDTGIIFAMPVSKTWGIPQGAPADWAQGNESPE